MANLSPLARQEATVSSPLSSFLETQSNLAPPFPCATAKVATKPTATKATINPTSTFERILSFLLYAKVDTRLSSPPSGVNEKKPLNSFHVYTIFPSGG